MVCVFGESGARAEMVSNRDDHSPSSTPLKRFETPVKSDKKKNSVPARSAAGTTAKGLGTRYKSLTDLTGEHKGKERGRLTPKKRTTTATAARPLTSHAHTTSAATLRASLQEADLTYGRSKTSDAILSRTRRMAKDSESPHSVVKRRGNGNLSRETSSESIRLGRARTTGGRRKSVEGRKRSPEVRRRAAVSPAPTRRRLEPEYDTTSNDVQRRNALRKDLNDNNLHFSRSVSADTIGRGNFFCLWVKFFLFSISPLSTSVHHKSKYKKVGVLPIRIVYGLTFRALALSSIGENQLEVNFRC